MNKLNKLNKLNMYGCSPCPKCKSVYRWPTTDKHSTDPNMILCDDCGYKESYTPPWNFCGDTDE